MSATVLTPTSPSARSRPVSRGGTPTWALKVLMAVSGLIWALFAAVHMYGNLKIYTGAESFDGYALWLREVGYPLVPHTGVLWILRVVLVISLLVHLWGAFSLHARGRRARGKVRAPRRGARMFAAGSMLATGVIILLGLVIHVLDLTLGIGPAPAEFVATTAGGSAYSNLIASFSRPWAAIVYVVWMVALSVHLLHGTQLAANDLGATGHRLRTVALWVGVLLAVAVFLGNASIPLAVQLGVLA